MLHETDITKLCNPTNSLCQQVWINQLWQICNPEICELQIKYAVIKSVCRKHSCGRGRGARSITSVRSLLGHKELQCDLSVFSLHVELCFCFAC